MIRNRIVNIEGWLTILFVGYYLELLFGDLTRVSVTLHVLTSLVLRCVVNIYHMIITVLLLENRV